MFKKLIGISIYQYVIAQRIQRAQELLRRCDFTIGEIALRCGFANNTHLTKHLAPEYLVTPIARRRQRTTILYGLDCHQLSIVK
ncbi:helix-turn-helix domain-containing protein [Chamaesiphon sp.]|uniref:helix-turn-helix domain-containing protein n=1 Tax=Chamaesiphon sp. TaxID=2814140 RepID=UPI003592E966